MDLKMLGFEQEKSEYGYNIYIMGLILMLVVALVAQSLNSLNTSKTAEPNSSTRSRQLQNSPEVGN